MIDMDNLRKMRVGISAGRTMSLDLQIQLLDQAIEQQKVINRWYGLLVLIGRSSSSWATRVNTILNDYLFETISPDAINALKAVLKKHTDLSVKDLLTKVESLGDGKQTRE